MISPSREHPWKKHTFKPQVEREAAPTSDTTDLPEKHLLFKLQGGKCPICHRGMRVAIAWLTLDGDRLVHAACLSNVHKMSKNRLTNLKRRHYLVQRRAA